MISSGDGIVRQPDGPGEVARLKEIIRALMDRAERSTMSEGSDFSLFQTTIMLRQQVQRRTGELQEALREKEMINRRLRESEARFSGLVSQSLVGITLVENGKISYSNDRFRELFGYSSDEIRNLEPSRIAIESDRCLIEEQIRRRIDGELDRVHYVFRGQRKDGGLIDVELHGSVMRISDKPILVTMFLDVTQRVCAQREVLALQDRLREQATHDALTGLYNRRHLDDVFEREFTLAQRSGHPISVIMGDLDHFKAINDRYGHLAGDEVLRTVGGFVRTSSRCTDICCRYGGEEFLLVLPLMAHHTAAARAEQLRKAIASASVPWGGERLSVTASFGVATSPGNGNTSEQLIAAADAAMYQAKAAGRNCVHTSTRAHNQHARTG